MILFNLTSPWYHEVEPTTRDSYILIRVPSFFINNEKKNSEETHLKCP